MKHCAILMLVAIAAIPVPARATTHTVDVNGGADYTAIKVAAWAASEGDTILVYPGTYTGEDNLNIGADGTNLVFLAQTDGRAPVIIDGGCVGMDSAFLFSHGEDATTLVHGFTIQNCNAQGGAGFRATQSSPTVENCTFLSNHATARGGAIYLGASASTISDCVFRGNSAVTSGGAIYSHFGSSTTITGCLFDENSAPAPSVGGGAIHCMEGSETITLCTIVENNPDQVKVDDGSGVDIAYCIIANSVEGVGVTATPTDGAWVIRSVVFGNAGGDSLECAHVENIFHDPLFCNDVTDDYTLCDDSFAVHYNNMWGEQIGAYESGCEPCGTPVEPATWGAVKALFR